MKAALLIVLMFLTGLAAGVGACWYASPVWSYNEAIAMRERLVEASVAQYRAGRLSEAAVLMEEANFIASNEDKAWPVFFPWHAAVMRATGVFEYIHVGPAYRAPETAFLLRAAGDETNARHYYEISQQRSRRTEAQMDASSATFLREAASFQESENTSPGRE